MHLKYVWKSVPHTKEPQKGIISARMMGLLHWPVLVWNIWERWLDRGGGLLFSCSGGDEAGEKDCQRWGITRREDHMGSW